MTPLFMLAFKKGKANSSSQCMNAILFGTLILVLETVLLYMLACLKSFYLHYIMREMGVICNMGLFPPIHLDGTISNTCLMMTRDNYFEESFQNEVCWTVGDWTT